MNILIAGGSGMIGRALTGRCLEGDHKVTIISRNPQQLAGLPDSLTVVSWDEDQLQQEINRTDAVVNLAGSSLAGSKPWEMRWTERRKEDIIASRLKAGKAITAAISRADRKPELLIQASAIGFYGNRDYGAADETSAAGDDFLSRVCLEWEPSTQGVEALGLRRVVVRIGLVLNKGSNLMGLLKLPFSFYLGGKIGSGQQYFSWIHIDDVVGGICYLLQNRSSKGIYNLTSPHPVTNSQFAESLGRRMGRPSWFTLPAGLLRLALGEAATLALDGRPVYPRRISEAGYEFKYRTLDSALIHLIS
jgi:uncharacterized protein (TIGR01777 family)